MPHPLDILCSDTYPAHQRLDAVLALVNTLDGSLLPVFARILADSQENPEVRSAVALALGKVGQCCPEASVWRVCLGALTEVLGCTEDVLVQQNIVHALGMLGGQEAAEPISQALKSNNNAVFSSAVDALGHLGVAALPSLLKLLEEGADDARCIAAWHLGELADARAVPALVRSIEESQNIDLQALAIWALGRIGVWSREVQAVLTWAQQQASPDLRLRADIAAKKVALHHN